MFLLRFLLQAKHTLDNLLGEHFIERYFLVLAKRHSARLLSKRTAVTTVSFFFFDETISEFLPLDSISVLMHVLRWQQLYLILLCLYFFEWNRLSSLRCSLLQSLFLLQYKLQSVIGLYCTDNQFLNLSNSFVRLCVTVRWLILTLMVWCLCVEVVSWLYDKLSDRLTLVKNLAVNRDAGHLFTQILELYSGLDYLDICVSLLKSFLQLNHVVFKDLCTIDTLEYHFFIFLDHISLQCAFRSLLSLIHKLVQIFSERCLQEIIQLLGFINF